MIKRISLSLLFIFATQNACAEEPAHGKHTFGLQLSAGGAEYKGSSNDGDGIAQSYLYYNYQITPRFALEAGLNGGGDVDDWHCYENNSDDWVCRSDNRPFFNIQADQLDYGNVVVAVKANWPISARNSLYGKIGAQYFDYEFSRNDTILAHDTGIGALFEAGWKFQWDSGWGINAGYTYLDMDELETYSVNTGVSYRF